MNVSQGQKDEIIAASKKGMTREGMTRALGVSMAQISAVLGDDTERATSSAGCTKEALGGMGNKVLYKLLKDMDENPSAYRPSDMITASKEALDRFEGKPNTIVTQDVNINITNNKFKAMPSDDAYKFLIGGGRVQDLDVIEIDSKQ